MLHGRMVFVFCGLMALSGCGGGGESPQAQAQQQQSPNQPPSFTSASSVDVIEEKRRAIYTATASDPDGDALTFSLAGGVDRSSFWIARAGSLSFIAAPDFETPTDSDRNNVYQVRIGVSDGTTSATLNLAVTVTNRGPDAFRVSRVGQGFSRPLFVAPVPDGSRRVFVVEKGGLIRILDPATRTIAPTPFLNVSEVVNTAGERGLLGLATAPDFASSGTFYVNLSNLDGDTEIRRYRTLAGDRDRADPASADVILRIPQPTFGNHKGGWIGFGPDGFLYIASGDGGGQGDPSNNGQSRHTLLGKMLRIDVNRDGFPGNPQRDYLIPPDNPFVGRSGRGEIWALGLRNPFRASFDPVTGFLLIGDVGQAAREEIDLMRPGDGGANFGWSVVEGTLPFKGTAEPWFVPPVTEYPHGSGERQGNSVTGGYVYRGRIEALRGHYIFGDFAQGRIWSVRLSQFEVGKTLPNSQFVIRTFEFTPTAGAIDKITSFGVDERYNLFIVDFDGEIFKLEALLR